MTSTSPTRKTHTAGSAAILLMLSSFGSGLLALVRIRYVNSLFGAGAAQDAYRAAFTLPDLLNYFLIGGAASISLITILNRYREAGDEEGGDRALSVILTTMLVVLGTGVLLAEIFAPEYVWLANKGFRSDPVRAALCTALTRIILPAQLFFFIGSVMSSRLQVRKIFIYQAFTPLIYNGGIILGAILLHARLGIYSLAIGVIAGVLLGSAVLNSLGAFRTGFHYTPHVNFKSPAFLEWLKLSLPLMIGVSLVMFDGIFLKYFASVQHGGITLIGNAKDLFNAPFNIIGAAAGAASLPFFASLFQQNRAFDFSSSVGRSVSRLFAVSDARISLDDRPRPLAHGPLQERQIQPRRRPIRHPPLPDPLHHAPALGRARHLRPRLLRRIRHPHTRHHRHRHHSPLRAALLGTLQIPRPHRPRHRLRHRHPHPDRHARLPPPPQAPRLAHPPRVRRTSPRLRRRPPRLRRRLRCHPRPPFASTPLSRATKPTS